MTALSHFDIIKRLGPFMTSRGFSFKPGATSDIPAMCGSICPSIVQGKAAYTRTLQVDRGNDDQPTRQDFLTLVLKYCDVSS